MKQPDKGNWFSDRTFQIKKRRGKLSFSKKRPGFIDRSIICSGGFYEEK